MNTVELEKSTVLLKDCKQLGIKLLPPHINKSELDFSVVYDEEAILFGLEKVKRVGSIAPMIVEARGDVPFKSFKDFVMRAHFKKDATESLIMAGAFDCFEKNRAALRASLPELSSLKTEIDKLNSVIKESELLKANFDIYLNGKFEEGGFKHFKKMPATIELVEKKIVDSKRKLQEAKDKFETYDISYSYSGLSDGVSIVNNNPSTYNYENDVVFNQPSVVGYSFKGWTTSSMTTPTLDYSILKQLIGEVSLLKKGLELDEVQLKTDSKLMTVQKTIVGAINQNALDIKTIKNKLEKLIVIGTENDTTEDTILLINTSNDTEV